MPGKRLNSQSRQMVINLLSYFEREKENGGPLESVNCVQDRVAMALKISKRTICIIKQEHIHNPVLSSPGKKRPRQKTKTTDMSETSKMHIRNCLYNMYTKRQHVTISTLNHNLRTNDITNISNTSLKIVLNDLGFKFKKDDNRRVLMEKLHIACMRTHFLRKYSANKNSEISRQVVFLDETWIYSKGAKRKSWQDGTTKSVRKPEGYDGKRFIVLHAGTRSGFVKGASLLFHSKSNTSDYHGEMNHNIFVTWVKEQLIPNLEEPSLIIMDNAPYHSVLLEKQPCNSWKKSDIIEWLKRYDIKCNENFCKSELLQVAKCNRKEKVYVVDELLQEHGHEVLRLPPYHCDFNAIELIWAKAKTYYNQINGREGFSDESVKNMWDESLATCNDLWEKCIQHTETVIEEWHNRERLLTDLEIEPLIISVGTESSSSSELDE